MGYVGNLEVLGAVLLVLVIATKFDFSFRKKFVFSLFLLPLLIYFAIFIPRLLFYVFVNLGVVVFLIFPYFFGPNLPFLLYLGSLKFKLKFDYSYHTKDYEYMRSYLHSARNSNIGFDLPYMKIHDLEVKIYENDETTLSARVYVPKHLLPNGKNMKDIPSLIYLHGGGWIWGTDGRSLDTYDNVMRELALKFDSIVYGVDYRKAPEFPFPTPFQDSRKFVEYVVKELAPLYGSNPERIVLAGDSAGGSLCFAIVTHSILHEGFPKIYGQMLIYPSLFFYPSNKTKFKSYYTNRDAYVVDAKNAAQILNEYITPAFQQTEDVTKNPFISPLSCPDLPLGMYPPTMFVTTDLDFLYGDSVEMSKRLENAGIDVFWYEESTFHGYIVGNPRAVFENHEFDRFWKEVWNQIP